jgi:DNA polymerase III delta prime subunit
MNLSFYDDHPTLDDLDFKYDLIKNIPKVNINELVNLLFYGLPGSGKTTKIYALLSSIFGKNVYDLKNIEYEEDRKTMIYRASVYHIEINTITLGSNEKLFIGSFLKTYSETKNIGLNIPKIILIKNADLLSNQSQMALRKIIEKTSSSAKFIFEVSRLSKISEPLLSRFLLLRVTMPPKEDILLCLKKFSNSRNIIISDEDLNSIIDNSCKISRIYNLKKIFGFYRYNITTNKKFELLYYNDFIEIYNIINNKKISFISLQKIRDIVNEMYINLIPMEELLIFLFEKFCIQFNNNNKLLDKLINITVKCDNNLKKGNKECIHLEFYIISIIELIHS